jgi:beta-lactamase regulating signal transducer with metallopeptidase domain
VIPSAETINVNIVRYAEKPTINSGVPAINQSVNPIISETFAAQTVTSVNPLDVWMYLLGYVWAVGLGCLLIYALIGYLRLHRKVSEAVLLRDNVWIADTVNSPFILGVIFPKIYVSSSTEESQMDYILAHEQAHIKRKDHIWKLLSYILLAVYWFHPLSWAAYILFCRDIELACDERVIREFNEDEKIKYSNTLLSCSMQRKLVMACPLAFGEVAVKERVKWVLNYKKSAFWLLCVSVAVCVIVAVCFLTNPVTGNAESAEVSYAPITDEETEAQSVQVEWGLGTYDAEAETDIEDEQAEIILNEWGYTYSIPENSGGTIKENGDNVPDSKSGDEGTAEESSEMILQWNDVQNSLEENKLCWLNNEYLKSYAENISFITSDSDIVTAKYSTQNSAVDVYVFTVAQDDDEYFEFISNYPSELYNVRQIGEEKIWQCFSYKGYDGTEYTSAVFADENIVCEIKFENCDEQFICNTLAVY